MVARDVLPSSLKEMGANVDVLPIYKTFRPRGLEKKLKKEFKKGIDAVLFTSSSTVHNLFKVKDSKKMLKDIPIGVIGPVTAETLRSYGFELSFMPKRYTAKNLFQELIKFFENKDNLRKIYK